MPIPTKLRVDDAISINGPWYTVFAIKGETATLHDSQGNVIRKTVTELTRDCSTMIGGVRARIGHPIKWLPIPKGCVFYGEDKGYLPPIFGGYDVDANGRVYPLRENTLKFAEFVAKMERLGISKDS